MLDSVFRCVRKRNAEKSDGSDVCHPGAFLSNATQNFDIGLNATKFYFASYNDTLEPGLGHPNMHEQFYNTYRGNYFLILPQVLDCAQIS